MWLLEKEFDSSILQAYIGKDKSMNAKKTKAKKKKVQNRRMRRTVMGTLSVVFMLSAIIVALIPTPKSEAANDTYLPTTPNISDVVGNADAYIPDYADYPVYSSGDGALMIAYGYKYNDNIAKAGVIVNCNSGRITGGLLKIDQDVPAYLFYNDKYIAVNKNNQPLYYVSSAPESVILDSNGNILGLASDADLTLCTSDNESEWLNRDNVLLYTDRTPRDPVMNGHHIVSENSVDILAFEKSEQLFIPIMYIGSKSCTRGNASSNTWATAMHNVTYNAADYALDGDEPHIKGVFEGIGNLSRIVLPDTFVAVGDNAFRATTLSSFDVGAHVIYIGNHAFRDSMLNSIHFSLADEGLGMISALHTIGDYAFAGSKLTSLVIPDSVTGIGNFCFKECKNLSAIDLGNGSIRMLIGHGLFYDCERLEQAVFPNNVSNIDEVEYTFFKCKNLTYLGLPDNAGRTTGPHIFRASNVMGCNHLKTVKVPNADIKLDCNHRDKVGLSQYGEFGDLYNPDATYDIFGVDNLGYDAARNEKYEIDPEFCILANQNSFAYAYAMEHGLAFGYLDPQYEDKFEKTIDGYTFSVNAAGELEYCNKIGLDGENVVIPSKIYKFTVNTILASTFRGNDEMKFVYIPKEITKIEDNAFSGCTNLRTVYFEDATNENLVIGEKAFCTGASSVGYAPDGSANVEDCLRFIGTISETSPAYQYAMNPANSYNAGSATPQLITYCSYFPENLQVRLCEDETGTYVPTLVDIPTEEELAQLTSTSVSLNSVLDDGYSLSAYSGNYLIDQTNQRENQIALNAYANYLNDPSMNSLSEEERAVIRAVYNIYVPQGVRVIGDDVFKDNTGLKTVVLDNVASIPEEAFRGCSALTDFTMNATENPEMEKIGSHAFSGCEKLINVSISPTVKQLDSIPFTGCSSLKDVSFQGSPLFTCEEGIIYRINDDGTRTIVECLEARGQKDGIGSSVLGPDDFDNVTKIEPYAFYDCGFVTIADLSESKVKEIPKSCFENATSLFMCNLPETLREIGDDAFKNTKLSKLDIPVDAANISDTAFLDANGELIDTMTVECPDGPTGLVWDYFTRLGIKTQRKDPEIFKVVFVYGDQYDLQFVEKGQSANPPVVEDKQFIGWSEDTSNVQADMFVKALYDTKNNVMDGRFKVRFMDMDGYVYFTQHLLPGECVHEPAAKPNKPGYIFIDWDPSNYLEIPVNDNWDVFARFEKDPNAAMDEEEKPSSLTEVFTVTFVDADGTTILDSQKVESGNKPIPTTVVPRREGYEFSTWSPSNYAELPIKSDLVVTAIYQKSAVDQTDNTPGNSGSDVAGDSSSAGSSGDSGVSSGNADSSDGNKNQGKPSGDQNSNTGNTATNTDKKPTNGSTTANGTISSNQSTTSKPTVNKETVVEATKSGISNKNLISASVSGSNDNFIVKVKDSEEAKAQVEQALLSEYGSLDNLKYFAMDISLYDSTGTTKIADTTGITVTITMPLPDVMAGYAGNNKAMAVKNGTMEKLSSRLITIDKVPCISFEATHFSPYAIYVETNNLTAGGVSDTTPKTGDPIHPKWFLAIGLALLSVIMFLGKGSKNKIVKVMK